MTGADLKTLDERLLAPGFFANPYPVYHELRTRDPVHWSESWGQWILTRYKDIVTVQRDFRHYTNVGRIVSFLDQLPDDVRDEIRPLYDNFTVGMPNNDPPEHTRVRGLVNKAFTPPIVDGMRQRVQEIVDELLDSIGNAETMDVIRDLAFPLPAIVIAETLGFPAKDRDRFKRWSDDIVAFHGTGRPDVDRVRQSLRGLLEAKEWLKDLAKERRQTPKDDLLSGLVAAEEQGAMLNETELLATCITLLTAGHETTTGLIGNGLLALLRHPDQMEKLRNDPGLMETAIEEFLRYDAPFQRTWRMTAEDVEIDGTAIPKGQTVTMILGAANRDPAIFPNPDTLDITRSPNAHVSFGGGVHFCIGAQLARRETDIALTTLFNRFPDLRLPDPPAGIEWQQNNAFHNLKSLPVQLR